MAVRNDNEEGYPAFEPEQGDACSREDFYAIDEGSGEVSMKNVSSAGSAINEYVHKHLSHGLSTTSRAAQAWWRSNGALEHRHTQGIYLKEYKTKDPVLYVYIDTSSLLVDFTTNKNIYLERLAYHGFHVSDIQFRRSRKGRRNQAVTPQTAKESAIPVKPLSQGENERIDAMCKNLPESLQERVSDTMKLMISRKRDQGAKNSN